MNDTINLDHLSENKPESSADVLERSTRLTLEHGDGARAAMSMDGRGEVHLLDYVKVLYKRRWTAFTVFALIVSAVTIYTFTTVPVYEASARLLIEADDPNVVSFKEVIDEERAKSDYYQTQYTILQSRALARKTLDSLKLWNSSYFTSRPSRGIVARLAGSLAGRKGSEDGNSIKSAADETAAQSRAIDAFLAGLTVAPIRASRLVDVRYELPDPVLASSIVNTLAKNYINQNLEYKFLASKEATDWLEQRLEEQKKQVEAAESALQLYRERNDAISFEDRQNITVQKLGDLNAAVTRAKTTRIEREALYNQLRASQNNPNALDAFPAILGNPFIQQLKGELADLQRQYARLSETLLDGHPDMVKLRLATQNTQNRLNAEIGKAVQSVRSEYEAALSQEDSLSRALNQQKAEALSMNRKSIEYGVLLRDVDSSKQIYDSLMQRAKETGVAGELKTSNVRVIDEAERPRSPTYPRRSLNMLAALFGGGLIAIIAVFFFDYIDGRIKTPDEVKSQLGLPHLGMLPLIDEDGGSAKRLIDGAVPANFAEAFRVLRTNVLFSSAVTGGQSILVTSTGPGEGKSLVASNLAVSLAQAGGRVLLMDADMRKPKAHQIFAMSQEPGLSNLLVANSKASECVKKSRVSGLWVLPSGKIPPNPAELLGSKRFKDFLASVREHFDWVVIDSPPVMAVADSSVIAHTTTGVLFVVGAEMTSRHTARHAVEQLDRAHARFFGAVLNKVDLQRNAYYYSQYYRREYATYYAAN